MQIVKLGTLHTFNNTLFSVWICVWNCILGWCCCCTFCWNSWRQIFIKGNIEFEWSSTGFQCFSFGISDIRSGQKYFSGWIIYLKVNLGACMQQMQLVQMKTLGKLNSFIQVCGWSSRSNFMGRSHCTSETAISRERGYHMWSWNNFLGHRIFFRCVSRVPKSRFNHHDYLVVAGPAVGKYLFNIGGFACPFWTLGCVILTFTMVLNFLLPNSPDNTSAEQRLTKDTSVARDIKVVNLLKVRYP